METAIDLDAILKAAKPGQEIKLSSGLHVTNSMTAYPVEGETGEILKAGCKLIGSNEGRTVITNTRTNPTNSINVITGEGNNVVQNLEVCGGAPGRDADLRVKINLVYLTGDRNVIDGVRGFQQYGTLKGMKESFGLAANGNQSQISNSSIDEAHGTYITAIQAARISNCNVRFQRDLWNTTPRFLAAYNVGDTEKGVVENSVSWWATSHIYRDWRITKDLTVRDTQAFGCQHGLCIRVQPDPEKPETSQTSGAVDLLRFTNNRILLDPAALEVAGVQIEHTVIEKAEVEVTSGFVNDVMILENIFDFMPGQRRTTSAHAVNIASRVAPTKRTETLGVNRFRFLGNMTHPDLEFRNYNGNADADGHIVVPIKWKN